LSTTGPPGDAEPAPRFAPGEVVGGRFEVVRYIAAGGTGEVYEVQDRETGGRVALKALHPELSEDGDDLARFRREVEDVRRLEHPGICRTFELGEHEGVPFLTMELLDGESLEARLARGPMTAEEALPLVRQMVAALSRAHGASLVHGDFKSGNVLLVPRDGGVRVVVTDFGTAPPRDAAPPDAPPDMVLGTPAYMAPEQALGEEFGPAADIYALGVVLFEMLTGALPHEGDTAVELLEQRVSELAPDPRSLAPDLGLRWQIAILRCLENEPDDRFKSVDDVLVALEGGRIPLSASGELRRRRRRQALAAGATLAAAAAAATWWLL
jgi:serine/threonine protein kinase